jgi:NADPH-dependent 2,4-dienoyl-CoA reductase/sulfur reductase-like enzyme
MSFDVLIIASGSKPNQLSCPGNDLHGVHGMYHKQDLDRLESLSHSIKSAVIVGGGLIGIELAEMLHSRGKKVTLIVRENSFWNRVLPDAESKMINSHIEAHGIRLLLETELKAINPSEQGGVKEVITNKGEVIPCEYVGSTIGVSPNVDFLKDSGINLGRGVLVNSFLETNLPDIYAIGDCAEQTQPQINRRPIEAVWYTGRIMGETLAKTLCGKREQYRPNHWFNSAKFFDIEYQTYGRVEAEPDPKDQKQFYWQHQSKNQLLRLSYHPETEILQGVNVMGIRMRHKIFEQWLDQNKTLEEVIDSLQEAYFDPEFSKNPIAKIKADFALIKQ